MNGAMAQAWDEGGNTITNLTKYVGCDLNSTVPLKVMHNANQPIDFYTRAIHRMRLTPYVSTAMGPLNEFPAVDREGFLLLSGQPNAFVHVNSRAPFTRLHLIDQAGNVDPNVYAQQHGYRPWMRNPSCLRVGSITLTGNRDQMYIGAEYNGNDNNGMVLPRNDRQRLRRPRSVA